MIGAIYSILTLKLTLKYYIYICKARITCTINLQIFLTQVTQIFWVDNFVM